MRCTNGLPDKQTVGYTLLELVAISGELPANQLCRLPGGDSYKLNVVRALKSQKLLRTYYRDGVRGYRLTASAKKALCRDVPERFSFSLSGSAETNLVKSEITRRLRLYRVAEATLTMKNAGVLIFRDEKPDVFSPEWEKTDSLSITAPAFYPRGRSRRWERYLLRSAAPVRLACYSPRPMCSWSMTSAIL